MQVIMYSHIDLQGSIPSSLINKLAASAPLGLLTSIKKIAEARS
jgi:hypothetical protein